MKIHVDYIRKGVPEHQDVGPDEFREATVSSLEAVIQIIKNEAEPKSVSFSCDGVDLCECGSMM